MDKVMKIIGAVVLGITALFCAYQLGRFYASVSPQPEPKPQVDTLIIRDTVVHDRPVYVTRMKLDSVLVPVEVADTLHTTDTVYVWLQREQVRWTDSLCTVYASGIKPQVDSVEHYISEKVVTVTVPVEVVKRTRWGIGIQAGAGVGKDGLTPYIGVGVSYNLLAF